MRNTREYVTAIVSLLPDTPGLEIPIDFGAMLIANATGKPYSLALAEREDNRELWHRIDGGEDYQAVRNEIEMRRARRELAAGWSAQWRVR